MLPTLHVRMHCINDSLIGSPETQQRWQKLQLCSGARSTVVHAQT